MKFIDPKTDYAFKRIFGSEDSDKTLISFLNSVLLLKNDRRIKSVSIKNPYQTAEIPVLKESIVDIACVDHRGVRYLVEMQVEKVKGFANRIVHNLAKCYSGQTKSGRDYIEANDVVIIAVMDFILLESHKKAHSIYVFKEQVENLEDFNQLKICCLELAKFKKSEAELSDTLDKWFYFLKETQNLNIRPSSLQGRDFDDAFEKAKAANLTEEEKELYDDAQIKIVDKRGMIEQALEDGESRGMKKGEEKGRKEGMKKGIEKGRKEGMEKGIEKGRKEGIEEGMEKGIKKTQKSLVLKLIESKMETDDICRLIGWTKEEVLKLKKDSKN